MIFRLKIGHHSDGTKKYKQGSKVRSEIDLEKRFGKDKFERLFDEERREEERKARGETEPQEVSEEEPSTDTVQGDVATLQTMTVAELKQLAESEEIDLGTAKTKEQIIKVIVDWNKG